MIICSPQLLWAWSTWCAFSQNDLSWLNSTCYFLSTKRAKQAQLDFQFFLYSKSGVGRLICKFFFKNRAVQVDFFVLHKQIESTEFVILFCKFSKIELTAGLDVRGKKPSESAQPDSSFLVSSKWFSFIKSSWAFSTRFFLLTIRVEKARPDVKTVIQHQNDPFVSPHTLPKRQIRAQIELSQSKARGGKKERKEKKRS